MLSLEALRSFLDFIIIRICRPPPHSHMESMVLTQLPDLVMSPCCHGCKFIDQIQPPDLLRLTYMVLLK